MTATSSGSGVSLSHSGSALAPRSKRRLEAFVRGGFAVAAGVSIVTTIGIIIALLLPSLEFFREVSVIEFVFGDRWAPRFADASFGVLPLVSATLWTTAIALTFAIPLGLGAAIFLAEYASTRLRKVLKPVLELLAGIPTVVYGLFALFFIQGVVIKDMLGWETGTFSVLAAGFVMGVMIIPTIASISEDAMSAVPMSMRQGSAALGANRMQTSLRVVFPAAISGIVAAIILGVSRAVGETMIVAIAAGQQARVVTGLLEQGQTMTGFIASAALGDSRVGSIEYNTLFAVGLLLFILTLTINFIAISFVRRIRKEY
jgi:phosphate transport system permease protein